MSTLDTESRSSNLAACVAPEDLNFGDYVAALNVVYQFPSYMWCCDSAPVEPHEPVMVQFRAPGAGTPLKIKAICLPFVFVKCPNGTVQTLDVRQIQLVRLNSEYASTVWKEMK